MPLSDGHVHEARGVAGDQHAVAAAPLGQRVVAALGNGLGAPLDQLAALEVRAEERMELHALQQLVHVEARVVVVEAHHEAERHLALARADRRSCRRRRRSGSGQPRVWMTASSGRFASQTSFTPSAKICGLGEPTCCHSRQAWPSAPRVPSASTVTRAVRSVGSA